MEKQPRGSLRVYLGAAPGVGKTFAMLNEGRRRFERGEDVVVAIYETHGRAATATQVGDLEVVPRKSVLHRGHRFEEMDLDAVIARCPAVALVDELAHTNVTGAGNEKRWQDVEVLLDAGIDVISTLNIQHLESINDVVARITGIAQQETIPDEFVRCADQLQMVDSAPETVRARLARGDIYPAERIDAALGNFFRPGNLAALRELALLWIADQVDEGIRTYRQRHGIEDTWETRERVVVAISGGLDEDQLIRRAARMARRANADLIAIHVEPQDGLSTSSDSDPMPSQVLVESLGGTFRDVVGSDVGGALVETARSINATQIVMGASSRGRFAEFLRGSVINSTIRMSGADLDVHVISRGGETTSTDDTRAVPRRARVRLSRSLPPRRTYFGLLVAVVGLAGATAALTMLHKHVALPNAILVYLLIVVAVSAIGGTTPAMAAALSGFLLVNWYFTPPYHTLTVTRSGDVLALVSFLIVAVVISSYVGLATQRAADAISARADAEALHGLSGSSSVQTILDRFCQAFGVDGATLFVGEDDDWRAEATAGEIPPLDRASAVELIAIGPHHVLATSGRPISAHARRVVDAFGHEIAASLEQEQLKSEAARVQELRAGNELRAALLSAVSHDLRTPIAAIKASATSLLQNDVDWSDKDRREFVETIDEETDRLNTLVGNLLDMSRIRTGTIDATTSSVGLDEVIPLVLRDFGPAASRVMVTVPEDLPSIKADVGLLNRVLFNVVDNALKHSPVDENVQVAAGVAGDYVDVRVADHGPGVSEEEKDRLFVPFQRLGDSRDSPGGIGLGLAVARGFVEAMHGEIEVEDTPGGGLTMVVRLRIT